jgi:peptidoglycan/LPS O-acetylase OafA/YrhL
LRAVAVLGVVLFHAASTAGSGSGYRWFFRGGFVGVDIFFVISGYLITGLLWKEAEKDHRISFAGFYARRARRLLPASMLVVVVTALAARRWMPPLQVPSVMKDGVASALYVGNYRFAFAQTNYLNATAPPSPFLHYWSLGVEEQFYLVWPLVLAGAAWLWARRRRQPSRAGAVAALAALTVGSFILSLWLTSANQPWAFFSLPTRAWELGAGGLLALSTPYVQKIPARVAGVAGWAGLAVLVGSVLLISPQAPFPGTVALFPVAATMMVLAAGGILDGERAGPAGLLGRSGMRMIGRISYSWYLWHWPFLILAPYVLGYRLNLMQNLMVAALSGVVATACFLLVETPARSSPWLGSMPRRSLVAGGVLSCTGAVACLAIGTSIPSLTGHGAARHASLVVPRPAANAPATTAAASGGSTTITTVDPLQAQVQSINAQIQGQLAASLRTQALPSNLTPSLSRANGDEPVVTVDGCMDGYTSAGAGSCVFGDVGSARNIVLFGDSHAAMWFPAVDYFANKYGYQLIAVTKATCPPMKLPIISPVLGRTFTECDQWVQNVLARIQQVHPALVLMGVARHYTSIYGFSPYDQTWLSAISQMVSQIKAMGSRAVLLGAIPKPPAVVPACLSSHINDAAACNMALPQVLNQAGVASEKAATSAGGGTYLDVLPWFCVAQACGTTLGNIEMWRDDNHITATYASFLGPAMSAELQDALKG